MHSALVRLSGNDISLLTYGGSLPKALEAARQLAQQEVSVEVIDLRSLRPLDTKTIFESVNKTHRLLVVDEGWRTGSLAGELCALVAENCFWSLDAPPIRVCSEEVPIPYPKHLEDAVTPQVEKIVNAVLDLLSKERVS